MMRAGRRAWRSSSSSVITHQLDGIPPQRIPAATSISNFLRITAGGVRDLDRDHDVGQPRGPAPEPAGRSVEPLRSDAAAGHWRRCRARASASDQAVGVLDARHGRAVRTCCRRSTISRSSTWTVAGARAARLAHAPAAGRERHRRRRRNRPGGVHSSGSFSSALQRLRCSCSAAARTPACRFESSSDDGIAHARADDAEVHGGIEQTRVPMGPVRKEFLDSLTQRHGPKSKPARRANSATGLSGP